VFAMSVRVHKLHFNKEVDGLIYKIIETEEEIKQCFELYQNSFLKDEPITKTFRDRSLQSQAEITFFDRALFHDPVRFGVSLIVVDPQKDNAVIGMRISKTADRIKKHSLRVKRLSYYQRASMDQGHDESLFANYSFYTRFVMECFDQLGTTEDLFEVFPDYYKIYYMLMMTVNPDYRGRGIASKLIDCCFEVAKMAGCDSAYVVATSPYTARIFQKQMTEFRSLRWEEIEFDGGNPCEDKDMGSEEIKSFSKQL